MGMVRILALVGALAAVMATAAQAGTTPSGDWWGNDLKPKSAMKTDSENFNYLKVVERVRSRYVILDGELTIDDPPGCLEEDYPSLNSCKAWAYQEPDALTLHVFHNGRKVFTDELNPMLDDYDKPYRGASFSTRLYLWEIAGSRCSPGKYVWRVQMVDPYLRRGFETNVSHAFNITCGS